MAGQQSGLVIARSAHGLKELFSVSTSGVDCTRITARFAHFGAALASLEKEPVYCTHAFARLSDNLFDGCVRRDSYRPFLILG